jgi:hypothetical protein
VNRRTESREGSGYSSSERSALVPDKLDELIVEVATSRNNVVEVVCPNNENALVTLVDLKFDIRSRMEKGIRKSN